MLAWPLYGAGMDKLGKNNEPCLVDVPQITDDELLVRIDAVGLCFSDIKLIKAGEAHPRVLSENLAQKPIIPGHEAVMTVVKIGARFANRFKVGQRFIIQADIYYRGVGIAYGYAINGGFAQYSVIDKRVIEGDEGCYLLPVSESLPAGLAALIEPWASVIASYMIDKRIAPLKTGKVLIVCEPDDKTIYVSGLRLTAAKPVSVSLLGCSNENIERFTKDFKNTYIRTFDKIPEREKFDDIFLCNIKDRAKAEGIAKLCNENAVVSFIGAYPDECWSFDVGAIHYKGWFYQGSNLNVLSSAYEKNVRTRLVKGGCCWLVGGAGGIGQMHTQLTVEATDGPSRILLTDLDDNRIESVHSLVKDKLAARNIEFKTLNPKNFSSQAEFDAEVAGFAEPSGGFDDIIMLAPVVSALNSAIPYMKKNGLMNISSSGIPAGEEGLLNVKQIAENGVRFIGASGSLTAHLNHTLKLVEEKKLNPASMLAAIGGIHELKKGLEAVADAEFPGKTVIFPNLEKLPFMPLNRIDELSDKLKSTLSKDGFYTDETEAELFRMFS